MRVPVNVIFKIIEDTVRPACKVNFHGTKPLTLQAGRTVSSIILKIIPLFITQKVVP